MSGVRLSSALREVRIVLCQYSAASTGAREFVSKHYVELKTENPTTPILVRECSDVQPMLYARFSHGREKSSFIADLESSDILERLKSMDETSLQEAANSSVL